MPQDTAKTPQPRRVHLIDGSGYIFRAYFGVRPLSRSDGLMTHAFLGFANMLGKLLREQQPTHIGIAFDTAEPTFRHQLYDGYKAHREAPPEDLLPQIPLIYELVRALRLTTWMLPGFEADDVLGSLARQATAQGLEAVLVTADKDLMQLVGPKVSMYDPMKDKHFDTQAVVERFGVGPEHVADVLALAGDTSDNIPGVPKVGLKTAAKWIGEYGGIEPLIAGLTKKTKRKAAEESVVVHQKEARLSKQLTVIDVYAPVTLDLDQLAKPTPDAPVLTELLTRLEAFGMLRQFKLGGTPPAAGQASPRSDAKDAASAPAEPDPSQDAPPPKSAPPTEKTPAAQASGPEALPGLSAEAALAPIDREAYQTIDAARPLEALCEAICQAGCMSVDLETTSLQPMAADIVGVAVAVPGAAPAYIPVGHHYLGVPRQLGLEAVMRRLEPLLKDARIAKIGQNIKYDAVVLARAGVRLGGIAHDSMVAAWLLDPGRPSLSLDSLAREFLGHQTVRFDDVTGKGKHRRPFYEVPIEVACGYAAEDADVALRLIAVMWPKLKAAALDGVYRDIEVPLIPVLADMEARGILLDTDHLRTLSRRFAGQKALIEQEIFSHIGAPINLGSPKQVGTLLFDTLKLVPPSASGSRRKTQGGSYSTDRRALKQLQHQHPVVQLLLAHRRLAKLQNTYADSLPQMVNPRTQRIHTQFNQTRTETGRLSSSDPNLQNIPIRSPDGKDDGRQIRAAFVAAPGWKLVSADYSQIELRLIAHLSEDPTFIEAFARGEDIHMTTAVAIFGQGALPDSEMRSRAKEINFGIPYGLTAFGLKDRLLHGPAEIDISMSEADGMIKRYFQRYPQVAAMLEGSAEEGTKRGFVTTMSGRRRYLPDLQHNSRPRREAARREAMNTPVQGSAADLIKMAMLRVEAGLRRQGLQARLLLQVHDELVVEAPSAEVKKVAALLVEEMSQVVRLKVDLTVETGRGANWAEAH